MANTNTKAGSLAAPTAGAVIAQVLLGAGGGAALAAGFYRVSCLCKFTAGSPAAIDADNFEFLVDDVSVGQCSAGLALNSDYKTDFSVSASQSLKIRAKGAATAGVTYDVVIVYTKDA